MRLFLRTFTALCLLSAPTVLVADIEPENPDAAKPPEVNRFDTQPGLPDVFHIDFAVDKKSVSPDGKYGVIYPDTPLLGNEDDKSYFVALHPLRILALLPPEYAIFERHCPELRVTWSPGSTAAVLTLNARKGCIFAELLEVRAGRLTRRTDLYSEVEKLAAQDFRRSGQPPYNEGAKFVALDGGWLEGLKEEADPVWQFKNNRQIQVNCPFSNSPDNDGDSAQRWSGRARAVWDIVQHKFTQQKFTRDRQ